MPDPRITEELLDAIAMAESNNNPRARGDLGLKNPAVGAYQMRSPAFQDVVNRRPAMRRYRFQDLVDNAELQREFARQYLDVLMKDYGLNTMEQSVQGYNAGPTAMRRGTAPASSQEYLEKVLGYLKGTP